jgi:hypothetical protein
MFEVFSNTETSVFGKRSSKRRTSTERLIYFRLYIICGGKFRCATDRLIRVDGTIILNLQKGLHQPRPGSHNEIDWWYWREREVDSLSCLPCCNNS